MDGLLLVSILLLQETTHPLAEEGVRIEASVAFGGHVGTADFTELRVRAFSARGGNVTLTTSGAAPDVSMEFRLPAGESIEMRMPLAIDAAGPSPVLIAGLDSRTAISVALDTIRHRQPSAVLVGAEATRALLQLPRTEAIGGHALPHFAPAYRQISALAIDGAAIGALDEMQLRALLQFAGTCGRLLFIQASKAIEQVFRNRAACGGRFLGSVEGEGNVEAAFLEILEQPGASVASPEQLNRLLAHSPGGAVNLTALAVFWCGYLLVFAILTMRPRTRVAALGFSGIGTLLVLVIWPVATSRTYAAWAEASTLDRVARYSAVERYSAPRVSTHKLPAAGFGAFASSIRASDYSLEWHADYAQSKLVWHASPLSHIDQLTYGSFTVDSRLRARLLEGAVRVCNAGSGESRGAYLQWQGDIYAVPPLAPGTAWTTAEGQLPEVDKPDRPALRLFANRSAGYALTLLQSLPVAGGDANDRAWLMRYEPDIGGDSQCGT